MLKKLSTLLLTGAFLFLLSTKTVRAEASLTLSPEEITVKETDIGKTYTIKVTNPTEKDIYVKAEEISVTRLSGGDFEVQKTTKDSTKSLEMFKETFTIKPNETIEHKVRVKFSSKNFVSEYPGIQYSLYSDNSFKTMVKDDKYIPFIIQSLSGEYKMDINLDITNQDITSDTLIHVRAEVANTGSKFFTPEGKISIYKGGTLITEVEINDLLPTRMYPTDNIVIDKDLTISDEKLDSVGEYTVKFTTKNDLLEKGKTIEMTFMFVPKLIYYLAGGLVAAIILVTIVISVIQKRKKSYN